MHNASNQYDVQSLQRLSVISSAILLNSHLLPLKLVYISYFRVILYLLISDSSTLKSSVIIRSITIKPAGARISLMITGLRRIYLSNYFQMELTPNICNNTIEYGFFINFFPFIQSFSKPSFKSVNHTKIPVSAGLHFDQRHSEMVR